MMNNIILILLACVLITFIILGIHEIIESNKFYKRINKQWDKLKYIDRSKEYYEFKYGEMEDDEDEKNI